MRIMVLPCDGIGPEIMGATLDAVEAANRKFELGVTTEEEISGFDSLKKHGITLQDEVLERAREEFDGVILGTQSHMDYPPLAEGGRNVSAGFRIGLDLYANVRPARSRSFLSNAAPGMDLVIMREATEGFYPDRNMYQGVGEMMPSPDMALSIRKITRQGSERICREAFKLARQRRNKVSAIHKANSFLMTDGLFLECFETVSKDFPDVETETVIVDAMAALLVRQPEKYDVVVATNFYGDILSDLASELSGSLGLAGSINANAETGLICAQAQHGSAPDIAGQNTANPTSLILSAAMMLTWLGEQRGVKKLMEAGAAMNSAVDLVLEDPAARTRDLGGTTNTAEFGRLVADAVGTA
ncbi:isocitrate/isopropylmalate dehydrogenase family protein [Denitrobaculum tricleocarpae]|uniref:Isocitrate/isopropylmalate dehydrogenase family protein n=1 Tax=Denitrobaculum tricleocarpae TaxID=2591009 RepID=A0A545TMW9_9PROT|nr:isocitrate/isopropylmalate dehydrogenase family protein [Denitrobaculum tricleocarpae]TQV78573.1 isocitrate/isopropylmalate dehydrogenase family protein [Denitrobaculum tricleocarpae]